MLRNIFIAAAAAAVLAVAPATGAEDRIRIGISSSSPGFLPTVVAEKKGFFARQGLVSEHIRISLAVAMNALGTGDLDYAVTMAQGVSAAVQGAPVKIVMMTQDKLVFFLMTKPNIQKVADLRGKVICISYFGSTTQLVADVIARQNGLTPGQEIKILPCGDDMGRLVSLDNGRVDGVIGGPPLNMWGAKKGYHVIAWAKDYTSLPQNAVIVTDKKIASARDQVKRTIKGTIEALRFIQENKNESIDILAAYSRTDKATATGMFESYFPAYSPNGNMTDAALGAALDDATARAKIEKKIPLTQIADPSLLAEAQKEMAAEKR
ncbi:MAG TPA: ABC transporter substrate-binding protein [Verrucomicrobiae bacterium]|jgi:NitT/TauT family transport system substrate-binding protein|nr:ABC transporter substrate-binding protein [Verrucomicrobiae bacterium]